MAKNLKERATSFLQQYQRENPATYAAAEQAIGAVLIADGIFGLDNPLGRDRRPGIFGTLVGIAMGVLFMFIPKIVNGLTQFDKMTATTEATVIEVGTNTSSNTCSMKVHYTVSGKEYTQQSTSTSSSNCSLTAGKSIVINYDPTNPGFWEYNIKTLDRFLQIFFWAGLLAFVSSIITFFIRLLSIIFGWKLLKDGRRNAANLPQGTNMQTVIDEIKHNFSASVFGFRQGPATAPAPNNPDVPTQ